MPSKRACEANGGVAESEGGTEPKPWYKCFVRNVLTGGLADLLLNVEASDAVSGDFAASLKIPWNRRAPKAGRVVKLTPGSRRRLIATAMRSMATLAKTYRTTLQFRDGLLSNTPRGKQYKRYYAKHLGEITRVASQDEWLMNRAGTTWLAVYPFVKAVVAEGARRKGAAGRGGSIRFSRSDHKRCVDLITRFRDASKDPTFKSVLREVDKDLAKYAGLSATEAVDRLRNTPARPA